MIQKIDNVYWVNPDDLIPYENNAKLHPPEQIDRLANGIKAFGWTQPIVIDKDNVIVIGHGRLMAAKQLHLEKVPVVMRDDLTDDEINACRLEDNKTNESDWDFEKLSVELAALDIAGIDMTQFGFEDIETQIDTQSVQEVETPEVPEEPKAKRGEIYRLGNHRLMCGDSTNREDVATLMDGEKAALLLTDPPYGTTAVEWDTNIDLNEMWAAIDKATNGETCKLVFSAQPFTTRLIQSNEKKFRYEIIWVKTQKTGFYNANRMPLKMHENIIVFYDNLPTYNPQKETVERNDIGRRRTKKADRCVLYGHVNAQDYIEDGTRYPGDVIEFSNWNGALFGNNDNATVHPTQKPVELLAYLIKTYSNDAENVLDIFGGSGSTLLACEQTGRKCYMMELDPHYIDVIIQRWENLTGQKAELIRSAIND